MTSSLLKKNNLVTSCHRWRKVIRRIIFQQTPRHLATAVVVLAAFAASPSEAEIIYTERSLYRNIMVRDESGRRCLLFSVRRHQRNQSCKDLYNPKRLVFPYVRMMFSGLLVMPEPQRILMIGLGGGSIPEALAEMFAESTITVVEIDKAVVRVARKYFDFNETDNMKTFVQDARVFVKRAIIREERYDLILLDAFTGDYIPEHLMTREFLEEMKALLTTGGVLVANTFSTSRLYDHESATYASVYGTFFNLRSDVSLNRIVIAIMGPLPPREVLDERAQQLLPALAPRGVEITSFPERMSLEPDWDLDARVLTDQYSPANLLNTD